jgi:hypothetical protein
MTNTLERTADRLALLARKYPEGIPADLIELEARRLRELADMVAKGLVE